MGGVAYAVQANDPTDTWRADRCTCVRKTCNGPWHATDRIFARYGDPFLVTNVLAPSGAHDVFCDGARGMKELARFPDLGSCYNAAKVDSDCDITHGVAYAVQENDPTDTWRADRCTCVRKTCNGPWHATDRIFARYGDPFLGAVLKECRWESNHDQNPNSADYMGWTCANDEILTGFGLSADQHDVTKVRCCKVGGHSSIKSNTCTYVESNHERAKCGNGNDHMVFSGAYDKRVAVNDAVTEILAGKC